MSASERKIVLVTQRTRLEELLARFHTLGQAKFYIEHLGADFSDYVREDAAYARARSATVETLQAWGRHQVIDRGHLPNFVFAADDIVVALGQDGLVANTMKYLAGRPLVGVNPEPARWDGVLLPFEPHDLKAVLAEVAADRRPTTSVTMAQARLSDAQTLLAVNDLFIGPRTHTSALYEIELGGQREAQSSSGLVVSTGLGSSAWLKGGDDQHRRHARLSGSLSHAICLWLCTREANALESTTGRATRQARQGTRCDRVVSRPCA